MVQEKVVCLPCKDNDLMDGFKVMLFLQVISHHHQKIHVNFTLLVKKK